MTNVKRYSEPYTGDREKMEAVFQEYIRCVVDCFGRVYDDRDYADEAAGGAASAGRKRAGNSLRAVCEEFDISIPKARKLLITAGVYSTEQSRQVARLTAEGRSLEEVMSLTGLSRSSVSSYLPYQRISYNMEETSRHAEGSKRYRERKQALANLHHLIETKAGIRKINAAVWACAIAHQNFYFHMADGTTFQYYVKRKENGEYGDNMAMIRRGVKRNFLVGRRRLLEAFRVVWNQIKLGKVLRVEYIFDDDGNVGGGDIGENGDNGIGGKGGNGGKVGGKDGKTDKDRRGGNGDIGDNGENGENGENIVKVVKTYAVTMPDVAGPEAFGRTRGAEFSYAILWKWNLFHAPQEVEEQMETHR